MEGAIMALESCKLKKIVGGIFILTGMGSVYAATFIYFWLSGSTPWYVYTTVPLLFAAYFILGTWKCKLIRVSVFLILPLMCQGFGLFLSFIFASWNCVKIPLHGALGNARLIASTGSNNASEVFILDYITNIETALTTSNYFLLVAPLSLYIYIFGYMFYELHLPANSIIPSTPTVKRQIFKFILSAYLYARTMAIGFIIGLCFTCYVIEHMSYVWLQATKMDASLGYQDFSFTNLSIFLILCLTFILISPLGGIMNSLASTILSLFYPTHFIGRASVANKTLEPVISPPSFVKTAYDAHGNEYDIPMTLLDFCCCLSWCVKQSGTAPASDSVTPESDCENPTCTDNAQTDALETKVKETPSSKPVIKTRPPQIAPPVLYSKPPLAPKPKINSIKKDSTEESPQSAHPLSIHHPSLTQTPTKSTRKAGSSQSSSNNQVDQYHRSQLKPSIMDL